MSKDLLKIEHLKVAYEERNRKKGRDNSSRVIDDLSLSVRQGEIFGLIGESGCGKTTTAKAICDLVKYEGTICFDDQDLCEMNRKQRSREIQMIFQNPYTSLNPVMKIKDILEEPLIIHKMYDRQERMVKVEEVLHLIGFTDEFKERYIHEMSGGQRQRIAIGCALMLHPRLVIADEVLSALDVSVQANILNLFVKINKELKVSFLFISHDINAVAYLCDRIAVMYKGQIVEMGDAFAIYEKPLHPYTRLLLETVVSVDKVIPPLDFTKDDRKQENLQQGCIYAGECPRCQEACLKQKVDLRGVSGGHSVRCIMEE